VRASLVSLAAGYAAARVEVQAGRSVLSRNLSPGEFTFDIPALLAGDYLFYWTIDPTSMHGTVTVH